MIRSQERVLLTAAILVAAFITGGCRRSPAEQPPRRPNILFVLLDDLRWDTLGYAGHRTVKTPHIDRLANEGRLLPERLLHDVALLAEPGVDPQRPLRPQARRDQQLHRVPGRDDQLSQGAAAGRLRHRLHRQVAHGRGERRAAAGLRLLRHAQGPGQVLRHRVQRRWRAARGHARLLHARRHRPRARLAAARSRRQAVPADARPQGAAQLLLAGAEVRARLRRRAGGVSRQSAFALDDKPDVDQGPAAAPGTASTARSSSSARSSPTTGPRPSRTSRT